MADDSTPLIDDDSPADDLYPPQFARGLVPRDYKEYPVEMFAPPSSMNLIPRSEWDARIDEQEAQQSSLEHLYLAAGWDHLDQGQYPLCWAHSTAHSIMLQRMVSNLPHVPLSAFGLAMKANGFKNQGGWSGLSAKQAREGGITTQAYWPQGSLSKSNDTPASQTEALKYRITEDYVDLTRSVYDQNLSFDQVASCLLSNIPCPVDFNWWAHAICGVRLIRVEAGSYGIRILNSWKGWGRRGLGDLRGTKAIPDGALATGVVAG